MVILTSLIILGLIIVYYEIKNAPTIDDDEYDS
jgi:hypothetical protein